jgi:transketolase
VRNVFCKSLVEHAQNEKFIFITGDLGYAALEPLQVALGGRFVNAGVAEQNMVSVAAGLSRSGFRAWTYSIAPFMYARPFEQIRNDVSMHRLPVVMVGNGGGYGYGVMGATHHALEDYGVLLTLRGLNVWIPAFDSDVRPIVDKLFVSTEPSYLRLGLSEEPKGIATPPFAGWRKLTSGDGATIVAVGPLAGSLWQACAEVSIELRPNLWCLGKLPLEPLPTNLLNDIRQTGTLLVAEEHVSQGSAGNLLALALIQARCLPERFIHRTALGYPSGKYGSQKFHRLECGMDPNSVLEAVRAKK